MSLLTPREREMGKLLEGLGPGDHAEEPGGGGLRAQRPAGHGAQDRRGLRAVHHRSGTKPIPADLRSLQDLRPACLDPGGQGSLHKADEPNSITGRPGIHSCGLWSSHNPNRRPGGDRTVIALLAARERKEGREPKVHGHKTARTLKEQQEYLISAYPERRASCGQKSAEAFRIYREDHYRLPGRAAAGRAGRAEDRREDQGARGWRV